MKRGKARTIFQNDKRKVHAKADVERFSGEKNFPTSSGQQAENWFSIKKFFVLYFVCVIIKFSYHGQITYLNLADVGTKEGKDEDMPKN